MHSEFGFVRTIVSDGLAMGKEGRRLASVAWHNLGATKSPTGVMSVTMISMATTSL